MKHIVFSLFAVMLAFASSAWAQTTPNTITVSGTGTVMVQPDMAQISIHFTHTAPTTQEAKNVVAKAMRQVQAILDEYKVDAKNVSTTSFSYDVEYEYVKGKRVLLGQRAEQTLCVKVKSIDKNPERLANILDRVAAIDKVEVQNIQFDVENKADLYRQSRALAYNKAYEKAAQYAELAHRTISKALTISEYNSQDVSFGNARSKMAMVNMAVEESADFAGGATLPMGEQGVTSIVNVIFEMGD